MSEWVECRFIHETLILSLLFWLECFDLFLTQSHLVLQLAVGIASWIMEEGFGVLVITAVAVHGGNWDFPRGSHG